MSKPLPTMTGRTPVISLGAGWQSSALLLMAAEGRFGIVPPLAIFADTENEPDDVYAYLDYLTEQVRGTIEVVRVSAGDLAGAALEREYNPIPLYRRNDNGSVSIGRRQCTKEFKLYPIRHELRRRGLTRVECWVGITVDEVERMKPSGLQWVENRWPLVEEGIRRHHCREWLIGNGHPEPPRSACTFCPYRSNAELRHMRDNDPVAWASAIKFDAAMTAKRGEYVHRTAVPLPMVDLSTLEDHGQLGFQDECEGMCGV